MQRTLCSETSPCVDNHDSFRGDTPTCGNRLGNIETPSTPILGLPVHMVQIPAVIEQMLRWITHEQTQTRWIVVADMHAIIESYNKPDFRHMLDQADLIVPDGYSLVWIGRHKGFSLEKRVSGTDLMRAYFNSSEGRQTRQFFYGDTDETLSRLTATLHRDFPGIRIAGTYSPPFRSLTPEESRHVIALINEAKPDVIWVGLGLPKQERWIFEHRSQLNVPLILGVGAAFKFLAGTVRRAPGWIGDCGFEWLWRLAHEPRRLWRRIFLEGPQFIGHVALDLSGVKKYS